MLSRVTFLTIGQAPRTDLVPEIVEAFPRSVEVVEIGALDGLESGEVAALAPGDYDHALVTRMRDGSQAVIGKRWVECRLQTILDRLDQGPGEATVLLCTGEFSSLRGRGLFLDAQHLVDHGVAALTAGVGSLGVVVPLARQEVELHVQPAAGQELVTAHASPYSGDTFKEVGLSLRECDVIVMHCMGYSLAQREAVALSSGRPVLLARRLVASAMAQLL